MLPAMLLFGCAATSIAAMRRQGIFWADRRQLGGLEVDRGRRWQAHFFLSRLASRIAASMPLFFRMDLTRT